MRPYLWQAVLAMAVVGAVAGQNIVDFSYSQLDTRPQKSAHAAANINIRPDQAVIQGYSFPDACLLARKLEQEKIEDARDLSHYDMDAMVDELKIDFIELLKVSERIKKKKANIQELSEMSGRTSNVTVLPAHELETLKLQEGRLVSINDEIRARTQQLEELVLDSMKDSNNNQFALSAVNFQIQSLKLKLQYLQGIKSSSINSDQAEVKKQFESYFTDLKTKFDEENALVDDLNNILKSYNEIGELKAKISNLKNKLDIDNLMIEEKQGCKNQRDEIKKFQSNDHEIKSLMANLREKKKEPSNVNNKYCEGVVRKLEDRIRRVLQSYDYTFECAQGLEELRSERDKNRKELQDAQKRLKQLEDNTKLEEYKKKYEQNRKYFKTKSAELGEFSIPKYSHDSAQITRLIKNTKEDLQAAENRKAQIGSPSSNKNVDYRKIQELVTSIKKLKGNYCQEYEKYEARANALWKQVHKYEAELEYTTKIRGIYEEEINELRQLESSFELLRQRILKRIQ